MNKNKWVTILITIQIIIISYLVGKIYISKIKVLNKVNINPIVQNSIISSPSDKLKYFYEPAPKSKTQDFWAGLYYGFYNINTDGLREDREYSTIKANKTFRVIALGDSFTFGIFVSAENTWPKLLEKKLNSLHCSKFSNYEVVNLGESGYDMQYSVERFKRRGQKYDPNLVLWFLIDNDFDWINEIVLKNNQKYERDMRDRADRYKSKHKVNDSDPAVTEILRTSQKHLQEDMKKEYNSIGEENIKNFEKKLISQLHSYHKGELVLFTLPTTSAKWKEFMKFTISPMRNTNYFDGIRDIYQTDATFLPKDGHPNEKGHNIIAEDLFNYLNKNKMLPCN